MWKHKEFLNELTKYSNVTIIPNNDKENYSDIEKIPTKKEEFNNQFTVIEEKCPWGVVICHAIQTDETIGNIKFNHPEFFQYLKQNRIYLSQDKFERKEVASIGFITQVHPSVVNRDVLNEEITNILKKTIE